MTLLLRTVVIASVLLVSTTATPPPGYVKQPDNDKNPPSYRYDYKIEDAASGEGQAKTEARQGERAQGRYYVNSKRASTDVKYQADDWGYHPLVKYSSADDHSSSSASLAFGRHDAENETSSTDIPLARKLAQVTQPYQSIVYSSSSSEHQSSSDGLSARQSDSSSSSELIGNYVTNPPAQTILETANDQAFHSTAHQSSTTQRYYHNHQQQQQSNLLASSQENDLSTGSLSDEDQLIVENAGSFGARVRDGGGGDISYSSPAPASSPDPLSSSSTRDGRRYYYHHIHGRLQQQKNGHLQATYLPSYFASTALPPSLLLLDSGVTANSIEGAAAGGLEQQINNAHKYEFSKPIVVAEPPQPSSGHKEAPFQYSTTFECEDDKSPTTPNPQQLLYSDDSAASSRVLNSIQAGVALVNAGEAHLIGSGADEARSPAPVEEKIDDFDQAGAPLTSVGVAQQQPQIHQNYVGINPAFGGQENSVEQQKSTAQPQQQPEAQAQTRPQHQQQQEDSVVEIQKSIEIYHSSPQHEIHYPGTLPTQVAQIDQQPQQQQQYFEAAADKNIKQASSESRGDISYAEITGTYSKVTGGNEQPVYVVPPATYVLDNNSVQQQQQHHQDDVQNDATQQQNSHLIQLNEQQQQQQQQSDAYNSAIEQQDQLLLQTVAPKPLEQQESIYVTQPVGQIVEKQVPFPLALEISAPQSYPVHIEQVAEKKHPIHIPIPQPYPVEIAKYIEKAATSQAPHQLQYHQHQQQHHHLHHHQHYGQQHHGVSYQQIMKPQNHGLYPHHQQQLQQHFQRYVYEKQPVIPSSVKANLEHNPFLKKHPYSSYLPPKSNSLLHRRHAAAAVQRPSDFMGPPPLQRQQQSQQHTFQTKKSSFVSRPTIPSLRRARNHEPPRHPQKGNFRQSKIEYGFKPPMVPSVQYDEESASKVES